MTSVLTRAGFVHSWDLATGVDGPGTRFTLFLSGCPLRCVYCQNPDTWRVGEGRATSVDDVVRQLSRYRKLFERTGGGLTVSGGEPLLQAEFVAALFRECRLLGISTALDTSGALGARASDALLADTDLVLLDIKAFDERTYERVTQGGGLKPTVRFAMRLAALGVPTWIRFVVVPGLNDDPDEVRAYAHFVAGLPNVERVDVTGFHTMGAPKYAALHLPYPVADRPAPTPEQVDAVRTAFADEGLRVT